MIITTIHKAIVLLYGVKNEIRANDTARESVISAPPNTPVRIPIKARYDHHLWLDAVVWCV